VTYVGPPVAPPPGWYLDPAGAQRWWDGWQWGPAAPMRSESADGKTLALVAHLGFLGVGPVLPLVLRLTEGKRNAFVRHHATEALNFQLTYLLVFLVGFVAFVGTSVASTPPTGRATAVPPVFFVVFAAMMVAGVANLAFSVLGCVRASQERWWRYPVSIRFVRGARPRSARS
jgi:uncharacterized Tic20 family protein